MPIIMSQKTKEQVKELLTSTSALLTSYHKNEEVDLSTFVKMVNFKGIVPFDDIKKEPEYQDIEVLNGFNSAYASILNENIFIYDSEEGKNYKYDSICDLLRDKEEYKKFKFVTLEKYALLFVEYKLYANVARQKNNRDIKTAREFGDLSENAEYQIAREQQGLIEARIAELKAVFENCMIYDIKYSYDIAEPGATVTIKNLKTKQNKVFMLVGSYESDTDSVPQKISNEAPLGKAVFGKKKGDKVMVLMGKNKDIYEIIDIK